MNPSSVHRIGLGAAARLWRHGVGLGLRCLRVDPLLGLKRMVLPVSYWRTAEFDFVLRTLDTPPGTRVLDLGSPKELAAFLACRRGLHMVSTDILDEEVRIAGQYAQAIPKGGRCGILECARQDGRALSYPDGSFDAAFSVSVLEHVPDHGDSEAVQELVRVVRPGGLIVLTVPFDREYRETFVASQVYEREYSGTPVFFERHYDHHTLHQRLIHRGVRVEALEVWGESSFRAERFLARLGKGRAVLSPVESLFAWAALRHLRPSGPGSPMAAFVALRKEA